MKQKLVTALLIMVCFVLQCTMFKALALASISPNLLLIVTSSLGFMRGEREGLVIGFFCICRTALQSVTHSTAMSHY